jgi:hypothetical protein
VRSGIVAFNAFWKGSPFIVLLLNLGLFIPIGWGAPQGPALVVRNSVAIVPSVAGEVMRFPSSLPGSLIVTSRNMHKDLNAAPAQTVATRASTSCHNGANGDMIK